MEKNNTSWLVITNADNFYNPSFFKFLQNNTNIYDIFTFNMIHNNLPIFIEPVRGKIDLGSYAFSLDFLIRHRLTFTSSLPARCDPSDYHDLDGLFIEQLVRKNARIKHYEGFLFNHN